MLKNMQMRKLVLISVIIAAILTSGAYATADLEVDATLPSDSVIAGDTITLQLALTNNGDTGASEVNYEIIAGSEITGYSTGINSISSVPEGQTRRYKIPLTISSSAEDGTYPMTIKIRYGGGTDSPITISKTIRVGPQHSFYVSNIYYEKNALEPDTTREISVVVKNVGESNKYNVFAELDPNTTDIIPSGAGAETHVEKIASGASKILNFKVSIDSEAETKTYSTNLNIDYESGSGKQHSETITLGLPVSGTPVLEILNYEVEDGNFEVEIENLGTARAKAIRVELIQNGETIGVDVDNELRIDKHTTFRFETYKKGVGNLKIIYLDEQNVEYEKLINVQVNQSSGGS